jgi:glycosyltransferase involved in cell wall biosynthesis
LCVSELGKEQMSPGSVFVSTYPPRRCGIATFTLDLARAVGSHEIAVLHPTDGPTVYPLEVKHKIRRDVRGDYHRVAMALNESDARVVSVQHEYGIWGGSDGEFVLDFVGALTKPVVATLHTVPHTPSPGQRRVLIGLIDASAASVVMSRSAAALLARVYGVNEARLDVVPHGVPQLPLVEPDTVKPRLGMKVAPMILSFGLLGPGKGYESVIEAMPAVIKADPTAYYVILGATHPELLRREGEAYRNKLKDLAHALGVAERVLVIDRFVSRAELGTWLTAADIFVTPYPNPDQIVSGTLAYAMSAGKAIVSTRYSYAMEMLESGRGMLAASNSAQALAESLTEVLLDRELRNRLGRRAYEFSRTMVWTAVGARYGRIFERITAPMDRVPVSASPDRSVVGERGVGAGHA